MTETTRAFSLRHPSDPSIDGGVRPQGPSAPVVPAVADDSALSWELAMARAEAGPAGAPAGTDASAGTWSPFDTVGAAAAGRLAGPPGEPAGGLPGAALPGASGQAAAAAEPGMTSLNAAPGALSAQDLREYKWERMLLGLDPAANANSMAMDPSATDAVGAGPGSAQSDSLVAGFTTTQSLGGLPESDRPVVEGRSLVELVVDHQVQLQREEQVALDIGAAAISQQLHLEVVNTPDPLPLETIKSV